MYRLILASQSPRRRELLEKTGYKISVDFFSTDEYIENYDSMSEEIINCAQRKGEAYIGSIQKREGEEVLVVSADTMVVLDGKLLGKPDDEEDAYLKLRMLSASRHSVITGGVVFDLSNRSKYRFSDETFINFKYLSDVQIQEYIGSGEPMGKAGAYAIQGAAEEFVESIEGSWSNVVGFPMEKFEDLVLKIGWNIERR